MRGCEGAALRVFPATKDCMAAPCHDAYLMREVIRGHQRSSEVIRGHQRSSEVIRGHQRSSGEIRHATMRTLSTDRVCTDIGDFHQGEP